MTNILDDYSALARMKLIDPQIGYKEHYTNTSPKICYVNGVPCRPAEDIINDMLKKNKWLAAEAIANLRAKFHSNVRIRKENLHIYKEIEEDINEWFES